jgi:hypothetical protein
MSPEQLEAVSDDLKYHALQIYETYIQNGAKMEINITTKAKKEIEMGMQEHILHPALWDDAYGHIERTLQQNALTKFLKTKFFANPSADVLLELPRVTIRNLILGDFQSPYSFDDFLKHLQPVVFSLM